MCSLEQSASVSFTFLLLKMDITIQNSVPSYVRYVLQSSRALLLLRNMIRDSDSFSSSLSSLEAKFLWRNPTWAGTAPILLTFLISRIWWGSIKSNSYPGHHQTSARPGFNSLRQSLTDQAVRKTLKINRWLRHGKLLLIRNYLWRWY